MRGTAVAGSLSSWHTSLKWLLKKEKVAFAQLNERKRRGKKRERKDCKLALER